MDHLPDSGCPPEVVVPAPVTPRGRRTRAALVDAARRVFTAAGYVEGSIVAITQEAGVSNATFYTYFRSKEEIFLAVAADLVRMVETLTDALVHGLAPAEGVARANALFLDLYASHGRMLRVMAEAAGHNDAIRCALRDLRRVSVETAGRVYARLQADGVIDPTPDPRALAHVLGGATEQAAYVLLFLDPDIDRAELERTLNHVWRSALGITG